MWDSKADTCRLQTRKATAVNQSEPRDPTLHLYALQGRHWGFPNLKSKFKVKKDSYITEYITEWLCILNKIYFPFETRGWLDPKNTVRIPMIKLIFIARVVFCRGHFEFLIPMRSLLVRGLEPKLRKSLEFLLFSVSDRILREFASPWLSKFGFQTSH